jgi:hypothetical protein
MTDTITTHTSSRRRTRAVMTTAGLSALAMAIYQVATPGAPDASYETLVDWLREAVFLSYLLASCAAIRLAYRAAMAPRAAMLLVAGGYGAIVVGVSAGMVLGEDPEWFMVLGGPGNLAAVAGFVTWAVWGARRRVFTRPLALLCAVGGSFAVFGAEFGLSVLVAGFWLLLAQVSAARNPSAPRDR